MKKVQHKNIVELLDVYQSANNIYIVTEYCEEGDLKDYLKKKGKLSEPEALRLLRDIMSGFRYLYDHEIIHRDLKPANILMQKGRCKISDFGFAKNL
jgi:serine/threonine protein kinase